MLVQKVKLLLVFQSVDWNNLVNFGQREGTNSYFEIQVIENPRNYEIGTGSTCQSPTPLNRSRWLCASETPCAVMQW
jgi:hypothetical protein